MTVYSKKNVTSFLTINRFTRCFPAINRLEHIFLFQLYSWSIAAETPWVPFIQITEDRKRTETKSKSAGKPIWEDTFSSLVKQKYLTYLKRWACWARGAGYLLFGEWYSWERMAWLVFWLGLLANFTVMGSVAAGGFWPFKPLIASSASIRLSNRINPTPLDIPAYSEGN